MEDKKSIKENELGECLGDIQQVQAGLYSKTEIILSQVTESRVNTEAALVEIRGVTSVMEGVAKELAHGTDKAVLQQLARNMENAANNLQVQADSLQATTRLLPERIKAQVSIRFEGRNKIIFLILTAAALIASLSAGLWVSALQQNLRLKENDLKYRFLRLNIPAITFQVDTLYRHSPKSFETHLGTMEENKRIKEMAEADAAQKEKEAREARKRANQLRK